MPPSRSINSLDTSNHEEIETKSHRVYPLLGQVLASVSSCLLMTGMMTVWGFPAVALPQLTTPITTTTSHYHNTTTTTTPHYHNSTNITIIHLTQEQASWFATLPILLSVPGAILGGALGEWVGPRRLLLLLSFPLALSIVAMTLAVYPPLQTSASVPAILIFARIVQGSLVALLIPVVNIIPCEVANSSTRGFLASMVDAWASTGFLLCYIVGRYLPWYQAAWVLPVATIIPSFCGLLASHESPHWLLRRNRREEALATLRSLWGSTEEVKMEVRKYDSANKNQRALDLSCMTLTGVEELRVEVRNVGNATINNRRKKSWWKTKLNRFSVLPVALAVTLLMLKEMSGLSTVAIYMVRIFQMSGVNFDPFLSSVVVGSVRIASNFLGSLLLHHLPRKFLLLGGTALSTAANISIGVFFFLQSREYDTDVIGWMPLVSLMVFMVGMSVGVGPASWLVSMEILPGAVRFVGQGLTVTGYSVSSFLVTKTFDDVAGAVGLYGLFWCYAMGCIVYGVFVVVVVPETRGLSLKEIEEYWASRLGQHQPSDATLPLNDQAYTSYNEMLKGRG